MGYDLAAEHKFSKQNRRVKRATDGAYYEDSKYSVEKKKEAKRLAKQLRREQRKTREAA